MLIPLSANPTKWSNTLKQSVVNLPTNCLNVFDQFVGLTLRGLKTVLELDITDTLIQTDTNLTASFIYYVFREKILNDTKYDGPF